MIVTPHHRCKNNKPSKALGLSRLTLDFDLTAHLDHAVGRDLEEVTG
jgi:hypothetical protein